MEPLFQRLESVLEALGRTSLLDLLQPGVPPEQPRAALEPCGIVGSAEIESLFEWRNGTNLSTGDITLDDIHLFPGFYLLSIEDVVANYKSFVESDRWSVGWLPIFANGGGDFYVADLSPGSSGEVRHFRIEQVEHPIEFNSLRSMIVTLVVAFERQIFFVDPDGYLEMYDLEFASLCSSMNADVDWWSS